MPIQRHLSAKALRFTFFRLLLHATNEDTTHLRVILNYLNFLLSHSILLLHWLQWKSASMGFQNWIPLLKALKRWTSAISANSQSKSRETSYSGWELSESEISLRAGIEVQLRLLLFHIGVNFGPPITSKMKTKENFYQNWRLVFMKPSIYLPDIFLIHIHFIYVFNSLLTGILSSDAHLAFRRVPRGEAVIQYYHCPLHYNVNNILQYNSI